MTYLQFDVSGASPTEQWMSVSKEETQEPRRYDKHQVEISHFPFLSASAEDIPMSFMRYRPIGVELPILIGGSAGASMKYGGMTWTIVDPVRKEPEENSDEKFIIGSVVLTTPTAENDKIGEIIGQLGYSDAAEKFIREVINYLKAQNYKFKVSQTGEGEFLIYTEDGEGYNNILIDEDSDVEIMLIPKEGKVVRKTLYQEDGINIPVILRTFNELQSGSYS